MACWLADVPDVGDDGVIVGVASLDTGTHAAAELAAIEAQLIEMHRDIHRGRQLGVPVAHHQQLWREAAERHGELVVLVRAGL